MTEPARKFTPAAGDFAGVERYDLLIRLFTRENAWRPRLLERIAPRPGQTILEVGCGTGTLAIAIKRQCPASTVIAIDPDPQALAIARHKADMAGVKVDFREGFLDQQNFLPASIDCAYISLVLHQVPIAAKSQIIEQMTTRLKPDGSLHVADYARQSGLMRWLFKLTVQRADGVADTQPNADGLLETLLGSEALMPIGDDLRIATPSGTISLFSRQVRG
jgi:ubiquinone/menaquinone biosynthesis C-methylase UbiE